MRAAALTAALALLTAHGCSKSSSPAQNGDPITTPTAPAVVETPATPSSDVPTSEQEQAMPPETPSSPAQGSEVDRKARYEELLQLEKRKKDSGEVVEAENMQLATWRFFYQKITSGAGRIVKTDPAAVSSAGQVVAPKLKYASHFGALLRAPGASGSLILERVAWLYDSVPVMKDRVKKPEVAAVVTDPVLETDADGTTRFTGWIATPPNVSSPIQVAIVAPAEGDATVTTTSWKKLAQ